MAEFFQKRAYCLFETAIGPCGIAWSRQGIVRLQLPEANPKATKRRLLKEIGSAKPGIPQASVQKIISRIQKYFEKEEIDFSRVPLDLKGVAPFHRKVYEAARRIPWGKKTTYHELAQLAGSPTAFRAVGQALAKNPFAVLIPCHRVVSSGGDLGGFSAFGGTKTKKKLLRLENSE